MPRLSPPLFSVSGTKAIRSGLSADEMIELRRLAELGRLSATLLHEISNPLTSALLHLDRPEYQQLSGVRDARRSIKLLRRYVEAARQQVRKESTLSDFKLSSSVNEVKRVISPLARKAGISLKFDSIPPCRLYGDAVKFQQILANLTVNAIEAYPLESKGSLIKPVRVSLIASEHSLTIEVQDWGQGIKSSQLKHLFEPFYSTKSQAGHGLGIGLAIVEQYVVSDFGGSIKVTSSPRQGTTFIVVLPALYRPIS